MENVVHGYCVQSNLFNCSGRGDQVSRLKVVTFVSPPVGCSPGTLSTKGRNSDPYSERRHMETTQNSCKSFTSLMLNRKEGSDYTENLRYWIL